MNRVLGSLVLCLAVSCANSKPAPENEPAKLNTTSRLLSPVKVSWEEVSRDEHQAVVLAKVERVHKLDMPFMVKVDVPAGVTVKEGRQTLELLPNNEAVLVTERFVFTFDSVPAEDAVLHLDGNSGAMGFSSNIPYRFGRAAPADVDPATSGDGVTVGGKNRGPSVRLK
ncbi:MAG: hypothetical protein ACO1OB_29760 [Archangium sp.]